MYCPGCATQNLDDAKFCRACGTNLASVALAMSGQSSHVSHRDDRITKNPDKYRREGMNKVIEGTGLIASSALVCAALAFFSSKPDWIIIWVVFGAWLAVLGVLFIAKGISSLVEWKYASKELAKAEGGRFEMPAGIDLHDVAAPITSPKLTPITSVTEHTTKLLDDAKAQDGKR